MFYVNLGYQWDAPSKLTGLGGAILLASGRSSEHLRRAAHPGPKRMLFDPQLYLATLEADKATTTCARLATYSWFGVDGITEFDSSELNRTAWEKENKARVLDNWPSKAPAQSLYDRALDAINVQLEFNCTHCILPAPLTVSPDDDVAIAMEWIDAGLSAAADLEVPISRLATVALSENALSEAAFDTGGLIDQIIDQVTAREGIGGAYVVVAQNSSKPLEVCPFGRRAYLRISNALADLSLETVCNYADVFGAVCMGAGATVFATGPGHRRLCLSDFTDGDGGPTYPKFYSQSLVADLYTEDDLAAIANRDLFAILRRDGTVFSKDLLAAVRAGNSAATVGWAQAKGNHLGSRFHFLQKMVDEGNRFQELSRSARREHVRRWLIDARARQLLLREHKVETRGTLAPVHDWLKDFDDATK